MDLSPTDVDARLVLCSDYDIAGLREEAEEIAREVMQIDPTFSIAKYVENQPYRDENIVSRLVDGFRNAGLPELRAVADDIAQWLASPTGSERHSLVKTAPTPPARESSASA